MSTVALPRLYFDGHFYWNPSTYNNDDYSDPSQNKPPLIPYDAASATPNWPWLKQQYFEGRPVTQANFREWSFDDSFSVGPDKSLAPCEWNFFGGMECGFVTAEQPVLQQPPNPDDPGQPVFSKPTGDGTTTVSGYTGSDGGYSESGVPVGLELQFNTGPPAGPFGASPKLIDIDPTSPFTSQIFADDLRLGDGSTGFAGPLAERMHARWLYFNRNLNADGGLMIAGIASTVFQTVLPKSEIDWAGDSPVLAELRAAAEEASGVMLRWVAYDTRYFNGPYFGSQGNDQFPGMMSIRRLYIQYFADLARYEQGLIAEPPPPPCNRAYSRLVGWLGVWDDGDLVTVPGGRMLLPVILPNQPAGAPPPQPLYPQAHAPEPPQVPAGTGYPFGVATVERDDDFDRITVDLCAAIPELDSTGRFAPYGPVELGIVLDGEYNALATIVDDAGTFESEYVRTAGLIDVNTSSLLPVGGQQLTRDQFDSNPLVLRANTYTFDADEPPSSWPSRQEVALSENALNAQTDTRGLYVGEPAAGQEEPSTRFTIDVRSFGALPIEQIGLVVAQYDEKFALLTGDRRQLIVSYRTPAGQWIDVDSQTMIDATAGTVTAGLRGVSGANATTIGALSTLVFYPVASALVAGSGLSPENPITGLAGLDVPDGSNGNPPVSMTAAGYAAVRLYPYDSHDLAAFESYLATAPTVDEVNAWVFDKVYETFHLMYPVMDFIGTPQRFQAWRGRILEVTDPANFDTSAYMPPTRTLSAGKRSILERYDEYLDSVNEPDSPLRTGRPAAPGLRRG